MAKDRSETGVSGRDRQDGRPGMTMMPGNGERGVTTGPDKERKDQTNTSSPRNDSTDKRPGVTMMPGNGETGVSTGGGGTGGGAAGGGGGAGGGAAGGGGGACEKYNCGCGDINGTINSYNEEVEALAAEPLDISGDLNDILDALVEKMQKIEYDPADNPGQNAGDKPCNQCGDCDDLKALLKRTIGDAKANAMIACCAPANISDRPGSEICQKGKNAFGDLNNNNNPCGQDADDQKGAQLFPCNPFKDIDPETKDIEVPLYSCFEDKMGCKDRIKLVVNQSGTSTIKIPDVSTIQNTLVKIDNYLKNVRQALSTKEMGLGGPATSLKDEACLNTLLNMICDRKIKGKPGDPSNATYGSRCMGAMRAIGCPRNKFAEDLCAQLGTEIAWNHTLTYGHVGEATTDCGDNGAWQKNHDPNNQENDIIPCDDGSRVRATDVAFVPAGGNLEDAIEAKFNELKKAFPKGCDGNANLRKELEGRDGNGPRVIETCDGTKPCGCAPPGLPQATVKKLAELQEQLIRKNIEIGTLPPQMVAIENAITGIKVPARGGDIQRLENLRQQLEALQQKMNQLSAEIDAIVAQIKAVRDAANNTLVGECVEFQYSYCPATSTPKQSPNNGNGGNPNGGGKSKTEEKDYNHSNFYDLLRELLNKTTLGNPCNASPLAQPINDCFGSQTGKNPMGDTLGGNDSGPTLRPGGKGQPPGSPCSENDGVDHIPSGGPCKGEDEDINHFREINLKRNKCITRLNNIAQQLNKKLSASGLADPAGKSLAEKFQPLTDALKSIEEALSNITIGGDPSCAGFTMSDSIDAIRKVKNKMQNIKKKLKDVIKL